MQEQQEVINRVYEGLLDYYGEIDWWDVDDPFEVMTGAILVQFTSWRNAAAAIDNFSGQLTPEYIEQLSLDELAQTIRPSGFYNQKAQKLKGLTQWFKQYDYNIELARKQPQIQLRTELLNIKGIGPETADAILVYALHKASFVIDAYTRRLFTRVGMQLPKSYEKLRLLFESAQPRSVQRYNEYHGLIVEHCIAFCKKTPQCESCPLDRLCLKLDF